MRPIHSIFVAFMAAVAFVSGCTAASQGVKVDFANNDPESESLYVCATDTSGTKLTCVTAEQFLKAHEDSMLHNL